MMVKGKGNDDSVIVENDEKQLMTEESESGQIDHMDLAKFTSGRGIDMNQ